ncbi:MAG TPA: SGNH/GDSL hydrolase family protein [Candidatus Baltobacteraceae bacterium]|jgi:lysophospholipase L1-like esterase|nr:SGNH/GDSL hydrolase family protein [Candidatus Baltobacteraceae bacterium]
MHRATPVSSAAARLAMVVLGDSLAFGYGASTPENGLAHRIFDALRASRPGSTYANFAVPHATMGDVLRHQVPKLHRAQADVVLLVAGANDLRYTRDRFVFARRFAHLLAAVRDAAPDAVLLAGGMPDVTQTVGVAPLLKLPIMHICARLNERMRSIAGQFDACFIDLFTYTNAPLKAAALYLCDDGYHPNDDGYAEISERSYAVIAEHLSRSVREG